jgi:uncharacterized protein YegJ (DUF2314 family)
MRSLFGLTDWLMPAGRQLGLVMAFATLATTGSALAAETVIYLPADDPEMSAAMETARESLPDFWAVLADPQPGEEGFAVKIYYPYPVEPGQDANTEDPGGEYIWANEVVRNGDLITATINNEPENLPDLAIGQQVTVPIARLMDWMYERDGKIVGGQTIRALLPRMQPEQSHLIASRLAPQ